MTLPTLRGAQRVVVALLVCSLAQLTHLSPSRAERTRCGPNDCGKDESCCNYGCGICVPNDGVHGCIQPLCYWGRPGAIEPVERPGIDVYDRVQSRISISEIEQRPEDGFPVTSLNAYRVALGIQHYVREKTAIRAQIAGTQLDDSNLAPDGQTRGFALTAGLSYSPSLGVRRRLIQWSGVIDTEASFGPNPQPTLAPTVLTDLRVTSVGAGIAVAIGVPAVPVSGHLRYVHSWIQGGDQVGYLDVGLGVSTDLQWIQLPLGARVSYRFAEEFTGGDYRAYEFDGGLYYFKSRKLRLGLDSGVAFVRIGPNLNARTTRVLLRLDWHWDANA